jgi:succinyl-diaminopimelate desuccinylase
VIAALAFVKNNIMPEKTIKLLFAADEENGSEYGADFLLKEHSYLFNKNDMIIIPDSGDANGASIEIAEKNILWMKFTVHGKQAHGSRPDQGVNASLHGAELITRLHKELYFKFHKLDKLFEPPQSTFEPTRRDHNVDNVNTIPGEDVFYFDMRILPQYRLKEVIAEIDNIIHDFTRLNHVQIKTEILQGKESKATAQDCALVKSLGEKIKTILKVSPKTIGIGGGTVAAGFREIGIDSAVWAVTDDNAHAPNEYIRIKSLLDTALVMAAMAE